MDESQNQLVVIQPPGTEPEDEQVTPSELAQAGDVLGTPLDANKIKQVAKVGRNLRQKGAQDFVLGVCFLQIEHFRQVGEFYDPLSMGQTIDGVSLTKDEKLRYLEYKTKVASAITPFLKIIQELTSDGEKGKRRKGVKLQPAPVLHNPARGIGFRAAQTQN